MITLYLVRHGETTYNAEGRIQGHTDAPLSALGVKQAEAVAGRLSKETFTAIYSSDLGRASSTADIIAANHNLPVNTTPLIRESNLGVLQGLTRAEVEERYPTNLHEWRRNPLTMRPPGAETQEDVITRCADFLLNISNTHKDGDKILVVGHGGSLRGIIVAALGLSSAFYRMMHCSNTSLSILEIGESASLWLLNDTCHLNSLATLEEDADNVER